MPQHERGLYEPGEDVRVFDGSEDEEDVEGSRLPLLIVLALLVLAMFAGFVWLAYSEGVARGRGETPVVTAEAGPARVAPQTAGGASEPYKGFKIYEQPAPPDDDTAQNTAPAQHPAAAAPAAPQAKVAPVETAPQATAKVEPPKPAPVTKAEAPPAPPKVAAVVAPKPAAPVTKAAPLPVQPAAPIGPATAPPRSLGTTATPVPTTTVKPVTAAPMPTASAPVASGSYVLQIGAYKSQADANTAWTVYKSKHTSLLAGYSPDVQQADLGEKGTWYRLRIAGFSSRDVASALCDRLKADGGGCFLEKCVPRAIYGCGGPALSAEEVIFFRDVSPWGFILFGRNIETPDQVRSLVHALRETVGDASAPVLIDQEGGRVARLRPPHWHERPPAARFGALHVHNPEAAREATYLGARLIAHDLASLGINVDCLPVLDVPSSGAHDIIGDRAFAHDSVTVIDLGRAQIEGLMDGGVLPVMKHIPGHGRAGADSHLVLPRVHARVEELSASDFVTFRSLDLCPMAMTAHVVYDSIDPQRPATTSPKVIRDVIRGEIGFDGLLMSDDLSMQALNGPLDARARAALFAGCDVVLHCNGDMDEMRLVATETKILDGIALRRADAALAHLARSDDRDSFDPAAAEARMAQLLATP